MSDGLTVYLVVKYFTLYRETMSLAYHAMIFVPFLTLHPLPYVRIRERLSCQCDRYDINIHCSAKPWLIRQRQITIYPVHAEDGQDLTFTFRQRELASEPTSHGFQIPTFYGEWVILRIH